MHFILEESSDDNSEVLINGMTKLTFL